MINMTITHKKGLAIQKHRIETAPDMATARKIAERHEWDGTMQYGAKTLPLRIAR